ncbi:MAG: hypothetical protein GXX90_05130 [Microbacteriaceae bacterium]|nr:hypothetical protein [Microbacteriaceae bacterium]
MTSGEITLNDASRTGGGVNVISNRVLLSGGLIDDNWAAGQGGGVYVATQSYTLQIENALIEGNSALHVGGGIWTCPTGELELRVTQGGAVLGNTATAYGDDIAHDNFGSIGSLSMHLSNRLLGGGEVAYHWDNPGARFDPANPGEQVIMRGGKLFEQGLVAVADDAAVAAAHDAAQLRITNNVSNRGGGIGTNGTVLIGYDETVDVAIAKTWLDADGAALPAEELPKSVDFELLRFALDADAYADLVGDGGTVDLGGIDLDAVVLEPVLDLAVDAEAAPEAVIPSCERPRSTASPARSRRCSRPPPARPSSSSRSTRRTRRCRRRLRRRPCRRPLRRPTRRPRPRPSRPRRRCRPTRSRPATCRAPAPSPAPRSRRRSRRSSPAAPCSSRSCGDAAPDRRGARSGAAVRRRPGSRTALR